MKVSVILPNYNCERFLKESIESVLSQSYADFELILVDDGSTDGSREIIESFKDSRLKPVFLEENVGICRALNIGLKLAKGEYIARMDSDDVWDMNKLHKQIQYLDMLRSMDLCFCFARIIDEGGYNGGIRYPQMEELFHTPITTQKELFERLVFQGNCLNHPSVMIRRSSFEEVGMYYRPSQGKLQDLELWIRFLKNGKHIGMIEEELLSYRWLPHLGLNDSFPNKRNIQQAYNEHVSIMKKAFLEMDDQVYQEWYKEEFIQKEANDIYSFAIEKAFYLLKKKSEFELMPVIIDLFDFVLDSEEGQELLFKNYGFKMKDYYRLLQNPLYFDEIAMKDSIEKEKRIAYLEQKIVRTRVSYEETRSWKITKPLRDLKKLKK